MLTQEKSQTQAPSVWDKPTASAQIGDYFHIAFAPVMQVVEKDVIEGGRVWLLVKPTTNSYTEEWVVEPESPQETQQQKEAPPQPTGIAGDSVSVGLQPTQEALAEFDQGRHHGQQDAQAGLHPIYSAPSNAYAAGYLEGYNGVLNPTTQLPEVSSPAQTWSVSYDSKWDWYRAYVGYRCIGHGTTYQEAERIAQRYIAANEMIRRQNAVVMTAYSC